MTEKNPLLTEKRHGRKGKRHIKKMECLSLDQDLVLRGTR